MKLIPAVAVSRRRMAMLLVAIAWLPLALLCWRDGKLAGDAVDIALLVDPVAYSRYLVAIPLLVLFHAIVDRRTADALTMLGRTGVVAGSATAAVAALFEQAERSWQSRKVRLALATVSVAMAALAWPAKSLVGVSTWVWHTVDGTVQVTAAGWWNLLVSGPIVRWLLLLALWRLLVWGRLLWRLAKMPLNYIPLHPDRCGGIGFLDAVQVGFAGFGAACGFQFGCLVASAVIYGGYDIESMKSAAAALTVVMIVVIFAPSLAFIRPLQRVTRDAEQRFWAWSARAALHVDRAMSETSDDAIAAQLGTSSVSSLTDATALLREARRLQPIPVRLRSLLAVAVVMLVSMALPLLPLLPLQQIARRLAGIVL